MMRNIRSYLLKIYIWFEVLCMAGCSSFRTIYTPTPAPVPTRVPTSPVIMPPTSLLLTGKIAFTSGDMPNYHINVMNANGNELIDITPSELRYISFLDWSPDGRYIAFSAWKDNAIQVFTIKPDGSNLVQLTFGTEGGSSPSWSPDGKNIMFISSNPDILDYSGKPASQIYIMRSDGTEIRRFMVKTKADNTNMSGSYRKDGFIAIDEPVTRQASENYIVNSEGVIQKQFPVLTMTVNIDWSPDGKYVVYSPDPRVSDCLGIEIMKFDESDRKCLMNQKPNSSAYFGGISWSPDGKYILFSSNLNGAYNIYVIRSDGSEQAQLTNMPGDEGWAVWSAGP
jgi:Tol biopolymer transport system component